MQPFCVVQELEADPSTYWDLYFDDAFNRAFYDSVDIDCELLRDERDGAQILRETRYTVRAPVPAFVKPWLPNGLGYLERAAFDRAAQVLTHTIHPYAAGTRTDIRATLRVESIGPRRARRIYEGSVSIQVPLIGARLERNTVRNIADSQERASAVTRAWLAERVRRQPAAALA